MKLSCAAEKSVEKGLLDQKKPSVEGLEKSNQISETALELPN